MTASTDGMNRSFSKDKGFFFSLKSKPISFFGGASLSLSKQQVILNNPFQIFKGYFGRIAQGIDQFVLFLLGHSSEHDFRCW